jgi:hypothetical protein
MPELQNVTLGELDGGNVILQCNEYLKDIITDIADVNKKAGKVRELVLKVAFVPSKSRRECEVSYHVSMKPGPHVDREKTTLYIGKQKDGTPIATVFLPNQQTIPGFENSFVNGGEPSDEEEKVN